MSKKLQFPEGFLWGAATSAYQVEGGIENNDWARAGRDGKVPLAGNACEHYNRFEEDFDIAKSLGHNTHRLSIEWSRIEPTEGKFDAQEIAHYRNVVNALRARGITPMVTLWHFTLPLWLEEKKGCNCPDFPEHFTRYCTHVVHELQAEDILFVTMNESFVFALMGWLRGEWPPFERRSLWGANRMRRNLVRAHNQAYAAIKKINPALQVGVVKNNKVVVTNANPIYKVAAAFIHWMWNRWFLNQTRNHHDFIGLNYYFPQILGKRLGLSTTDMGWPIYPKGIYNTLMELARYTKPLYITENGIADASDEKRADFIRDHLSWMHRAIEDGADVRGYYHWAFLDNFEWAAGFEKRFGLVEMNYETQERTVRPSAHTYAQVCKTNTLEY